MTTDNILAPIAALALPDAAALGTRAQGALAFIESFEIKTTEDYGLAAEELQAIKARSKKLEEQRTAITKPINTALHAINDLFRGPSDLLAKAEGIVKTKMLAWDQERQRIAAEARAQAEAAAEAERKRLADESAARQREAEAQARAAADAKAAGDAQAAAIASANALRAQAEAQAAATNAQLVVAPMTVSTPKPIKGISTAKKVDFEVISLHELVKHVAAHPELLSLIAADTVKLRAYVRGLGTACALPGVRVFEQSVMSARTAA